MSLPQTAIDLATERRRASFDSRQLTYLVRGGKAACERFEKVHNMIASMPVFNKEDLCFLSREQRYKRGLEVRTTLTSSVTCSV
jgi:hypothetical protein